MSIETVFLKRGNKKYRSSVLIKGKKFRSQLFQRIVDAKLWEERIRQGCNIGKIPSFKDASLEWMKSHSRFNNKPSTIVKNEALLNELLPIFGHKKLSQIQSRDIEIHLSSLNEKGLARSSQMHRLAIIKSIYNWHIKRGMQVFNPCLAIQRPKTESPPIERWSSEQAEQFLFYTAEKYTYKQTWVHLFYLLAINTGARWSELLALDWSDIDLKRRQICIKQIFDSTLGTIRPSTKSGRFRFVGINDVLLDFLPQLKKDQTSGLIFQNLVSKPIDRRNFFKRHFVPDMADANVPRIKFHSLRHSYATFFMINGGNIFDLQKLLGHSTLRMTDHYAYFSPSHASQRANVVNMGRKLTVIEGGFGRSAS